MRTLDRVRLTGVRDPVRKYENCFSLLVRLQLKAA